ncbi:hypothetical protein ACFWIJ_26805, partial [Streptomyces sp. NPDC127079]
PPPRPPRRPPPPTPPTRPPPAPHPPPPRPPAPAGSGNLSAPADAEPGTDHGAHGEFDARSHPRSVQAALARHPAATAVTTAALTVAAVGGVRRLLGKGSA